MAGVSYNQFGVAMPTPQVQSPRTIEQLLAQIQAGAGNYLTPEEQQQVADYKAQQESRSSAMDRENLLSFIQQFQQQQQPRMDSYIKQGIEVADPWAAQRPQYQTQLNNFMSDPNAVQQTGAYKFRLQQGMDQLNKQLAAKGLLRSGNRLLETQKFGQDMASQEYENQYKRLSELAGVNAGSPAAAASVITNAQNQNNPLDWAKLYEAGRQANQAQATNVAKFGNVLSQYYTPARY